MAVSKHALTTTGTRVPYVITQRYLPPGQGDIPTNITMNNSNYVQRTYNITATCCN